MNLKHLNHFHATFILSWSWSWPWSYLYQARASLTFSKNAITMTTTKTTSISASSSDLCEQLRFVITWHLPMTHSLTLCPKQWPYCRDRWKLTDTGMPTHTHKCSQACLIRSRGILYGHISRKLARTHKSCTLTHLASEFQLSNGAKLNL